MAYNQITSQQVSTVSLKMDIADIAANLGYGRNMRILVCLNRGELCARLIVGDTIKFEARAQREQDTDADVLKRLHAMMMAQVEA